RNHVDAAAAERLLEHGVSALAQERGKHARHFPFPPGGRVDVDQQPGEGDEVDVAHRIQVSSSVRVSVRSSRYFTMTGVASESPHSRPVPTVTCRAPGTTTAPSGT